MSSIVCTRYANALLDLAQDAKSVEKVLSDFNDLEAMLAESAEFSDVVRSPRVSREQQAGVVAALSKKAKLDKLSSDFLNVLVENRRLSALGGIIKAFRAELSRRRGDVTVRVETAVEMSAKQAKDLEKKITDALGRGVAMEARVNPDILGGMVLTIGSYMIDDSVRRKLERLGAVLIGGSGKAKTVQNLKEVG